MYVKLENNKKLYNSLKLVSSQGDLGQYDNVKHIGINKETCHKKYSSAM
jgi:hypothetical protein